MNEILREKLAKVEKLIREDYALKQQIEKLIKEIEEIEKNEMKEKTLDKIYTHIV